jgi:UDP-N-acetylglucosamine 2-epimerase (non-hydrolysing)
MATDTMTEKATSPHPARRHGTNELIGTDPENLGPALSRLMAGQWKKGGIPERWDGRAAVRIVTELERLLGV